MESDQLLITRTSHKGAVGRSTVDRGLGARLAEQERDVTSEEPAVSDSD